MWFMVDVIAVYAKKCQKRLVAGRSCNPYPRARKLYIGLVVPGCRRAVGYPWDCRSATKKTARGKHDFFFLALPGNVGGSFLESRSRQDACNHMGPYCEHDDEGMMHFY
jgi:hypothetical protein